MAYRLHLSKDNKQGMDQYPLNLTELFSIADVSHLPFKHAPSKIYAVLWLSRYSQPYIGPSIIWFGRFGGRAECTGGSGSQCPSS
jgi:hypothetical protein